MNRIWGSVAFRLALGYGVLAVASTLMVSAIFYYGTVGVVARRADAKLQLLSERLAEHYATRGPDGVRQEIEQLLTDGIDQDTEVYQLVGADGRKIAGNLTGWAPSPAESGGLGDRRGLRRGQPPGHRRRLPA